MKKLFKLLFFIGIYFLACCSLNNYIAPIWIHSRLFPSELLIYCFYFLALITGILYLNLKKPFLNSVIQKFGQLLNQLHPFLFLVILFLIPLFFHSLYLRFEFSTIMDSYKDYVSSLYLRGEWLPDFDDSPLYTGIMALIANLSGGMNYTHFMIANLCMGSLSILFFTQTLEQFFKSRAFTLILTSTLALYAPLAVWEAAFRYDVFTWLMQMVFFFQLTKTAFEFNPKNLMTLIFVSFIAAVSKETIIYFLPPLLIYFVVLIKTNQVHLKVKKILLIVTLIVLPIIISNFIKQKIYKNKFGISSIKKDDVFTLNMHLYSILQPDMETSFPTTRDLFWKLYTDRFTETERNLNVMEKSGLLGRYHEYLIPMIYHRDHEGRFDHGISAFLQEAILNHPWVYLKNSVIKFFGMSWNNGYRWNDGLAERVGQYIDSKPILRRINFIVGAFLSNYFVFSGLIFGLIFFNKGILKNHSLICILFCSTYPIYYGLFLSAATYGEYHRLMLVPHQYIIANIFIVVFLIYKYLEQLNLKIPKS